MMRPDMWRHVKLVAYEQGRDHAELGLLSFLQTRCTGMVDLQIQASGCPSVHKRTVSGCCAKSVVTPRIEQWPIQSWHAFAAASFRHTACQQGRRARGPVAGAGACAVPAVPAHPHARPRVDQQ